MVNTSGMNLLFFLGVLIPALVTVALFIVFCYCWYKMRLRNQILYKKHDPHGIEKLKDGEIYEPPPPPPPPFKSGMYLAEPMNHNNNNVNKGKAPTDNYEDSPEPTEGFVNQTMYRAKPDSGFSDLSQVQCNMMDNFQAQQQNSDMMGRPHSQASDDSDDSGFRSSRSGQYIHSASNSSGTAHDQCHTVQNSCHDTAPLFKPIKIHPNENGLLPSVSYMHRSSGKHKPLRHRSMLQPSHRNNAEIESHSLNNIHTISQIQPVFQYGSPHHVCHTNSHLCRMQHISKSNYDVHGGQLHSIDSHLRPLTSVGHIGPATSTYNTGHVSFLSHNGNYSDNVGSQPNSIGYGSDLNSLGQRQSFGHPGFLVNPTQIKRDLSCHIPLTSISVGQKTPISTHIPPFSESQISSHQSMHLHGDLRKMEEPFQMASQPPMQFTVTTAMVHRPHIEELADPSLYSVV